MKVRDINGQSERMELNAKFLAIINTAITSDLLKEYNIKATPKKGTSDTIVEVKLISDHFPEREVRVRETFQKGLVADHPRYNPQNPIGDSVMGIICGRLAESCMQWNLTNAVKEDEATEAPITIVIDGKEVDYVDVTPVRMFAKRDTMQEAIDYAQSVAEASESPIHTLTPVMVLLNTIACKYILIDREQAGLEYNSNSILKKKD